MRLGRPGFAAVELYLKVYGHYLTAAWRVVRRFSLASRCVRDCIEEGFGGRKTRATAAINLIGAAAASLYLP